MALEDLTGPNKFITALVNTNPLAADDRREGDDHIRGIKNVLHNTFPNLDGQVTATPAALNDAGKAVLRTGDTMTGQLNMKGVNVSLENGGQVVVADTLGPDRCAMTLAMTGTAAAPVPQLWAGKSGAGAPPVQMNFAGCPKYVFDTSVQANGEGGGFALNGYWMDGPNYWVNALSANPNWGPMLLRGMHIPGQYAGWRMGSDNAAAYVDFQISGNDAKVVVGGTGGGTMVQAARFAGKADNAGYADNAGLLGGQVAANLSVNYANRVGTLEGASGGTLTSAINIAGGPSYTTIGYDVTAGGNFKSLKSSPHWWRWHWNDPDGHFYAFVDDSNVGWATLNSDERLKENITPLASDEEAFMRIAPINFNWRAVGPRTSSGPKVDGLSAQNVRSCFPLATFGDFETPPNEDGTLDFPGAVDDRGVLAHTILRVQDLIRRVAELERLLAAAGA